jgi:hypothetical protein
MTPKKYDNSERAKKLLESVMIDCLKVINPELKDCTELDEIGEQIFDRMVYDKLATIVDLLYQDLGHLNDATRLSLSMDYEDALEMFKRVM